MIITATDQEAGNAGFAHFAERDFLGPGHSRHLFLGRASSAKHRRHDRAANAGEGGRQGLGRSAGSSQAQQPH